MFYTLQSGRIDMGKLSGVGGGDVAGEGEGLAAGALPVHLVPHTKCT